MAYDPTTGNLSKFSERVGAGHVPYHTAFGYDEENRPVHLQYSNGAQVTYTYDKLGRVTHRTVNLNGTPLTTAYTYAAGGHGENSTTPLVETITQNGTTTIYGYDDCGNIRYESTNGVAVAYAYDALGQLIRVNDPYDTTIGNGTTWEYSYDQGGNILSKRAYPYTTGLVSTPVQTVPYTYGDSNWKDKLTAYNGATITYDGIGNPLNDGTWSYTWAKGRQLQSMSKAGETVSFAYNADGLRVRKETTTTGVTDYTLHGKNIVHMTNGTNSLHFYYDAQNRPAVVEFNWVPYAYMHNLQGDVIAIVDNAGNKVVEYKYDAWGKPIAKTGSLANTLGTLNPFRYRGYVYDEETGLYYLKARYYRPCFCRFISPDVILAKSNSLSERNSWVYCNNRVTIMSDQAGLCATSSLVGMNNLNCDNCGCSKKAISMYLNFTPPPSSRTDSTLKAHFNYRAWQEDYPNCSWSDDNSWTLTFLIRDSISSEYEAYALNDLSTRQLNGEIRLHITGYHLLHLLPSEPTNCDVIDIEVYEGGKVRDGRPYIDIGSFFFYVEQYPRNPLFW